MENAIDSVLNRFRTAVDETYGKRIERVVLFGSRAVRCTSGFGLRCGSFLKNLDNFGQESRRIAELETDIHYDAGAVINAIRQ